MKKSATVLFFGMLFFSLYSVHYPTVKEIFSTKKAHKPFSMTYDELDSAIRIYSCNKKPLSVASDTILSEEKFPKCRICKKILIGKLYKIDCGHTLHYRCLNEHVRTKEGYNCPFVTCHRKINEKKYRRPLSVADCLAKGCEVALKTYDDDADVVSGISIKDAKRRDINLEKIDSFDGLYLQGSKKLSLFDCFTGDYPDMSSLDVIEELSISPVCCPLLQDNLPQQLAVLHLDHYSGKLNIQALGTLVDVQISNSCNLELILPENVRWVSLCNCNLSEVPDAVKGLKIEYLNLSHNFIATIEDGDIPLSVKILDISHCMLEKVPVSICRLENVEILSIDGNDNRMSFPENCFPLNLKILYIGGRLGRFWTYTTGMPFDLRYLLKLRELYIFGYNINIPKSLPKNVEKLCMNLNSDKHTTVIKGYDLYQYKASS